MVEIIRAAIAAAGAFTERKKVTERRLLLTLKHKGEVFVIGAEDQSIFSLQKHERATHKAQNILVAGGKGPWPFFSQQNMLRTSGKFRCGSFVKEHVEYDVLLIADCGMLGQKQGLTPLEALDTHGLQLMPFRTHPFGVDVKRVLQLS